MKLPTLVYRLAPHAAGACVVLAGWHFSQVYVAHGIASRAQRQPATARAAISELAQLGDSALPALLDAAVCDDREVSVPARQAIEAAIERWAAGGHRTVERRCLQVINGVLAREPLLTPSGRAWAALLGDHVLRALASAPTSSPDATTLARIEALYAAARLTSQYSDQPPRPRGVLPVAIPRPTVAAEGATVAPQHEPDMPPPPPLEVTELQRSEAASAGPTLEDFSSEFVFAGPQRRDDAAHAQPETRPSDSSATSPMAALPGNLDWRRPDATTEPPSPDATPAAESSAATPLAEQSLPQEVEDLLQGDDAAKLRLLEQLLAARHDNAATVLLRLAKDPSAKVRVSALSALGTSPNPRLTEAAYNMALHDEDPRVARLASELQKLLR